MKRLTTLFLLRVWLACAGSASALAAETNILPGVEFHRPPWERPGRLLFVYSEQRPPYLDVTTNMATLFELELRNGRLTPLCRAPTGDLVVSADGAAKCVLFEAGRVPTKSAFLALEGLQPPRVVEIGKTPLETVLASDHAYFCIEATNGTRIVEFTAGHPVARSIALPSAGGWQYEHSENLAVDPTLPGALCFRYEAYGKRLGPAPTSKPGWYRYEPVTGTISPVDVAAAQAGSRHRTGDGRCVFFTEDSGMKPARTLAIGTYDDELAEEGETKSPSFKVLTKLPAAGGLVANFLVHMSPCRRFAFVCSARNVRRGKAGLPGWSNTYYAVDLSDGRMTLLLRDSVATQVGGFMSRVSWAAEARTP